MREIRAQKALKAGAAAIIVLAMTVTSAWAQSSDRKVSRPPSEVDKVAGNYIQLEPIFIPVRNQAGNNILLGLVLRLWPNEAHRYDACVSIPWVVEQILIDFNHAPIDRKTYEDREKLAKRIKEIANTEVGKEAFKRIDILGFVEPPDPDSAALTGTCT